MCRIRMSLQTVLPCVYISLCYFQIFRFFPFLFSLLENRRIFFLSFPFFPSRAPGKKERYKKIKTSYRIYVTSPALCFITQEALRIHDFPFYHYTILYTITFNATQEFWFVHQKYYCRFTLDVDVTQFFLWWCCCCM